MKKIAISIITFLLVSISFTSCKDDCSIDKPTKTELLTQGVWNIANGTEEINGVVVDHIPFGVGDATISFLTDGKYVLYTNYSDGGDMSEWSLINDTEIKILDFFSFEIAHIDTLTNTELKLSHTYPEDNNGDVKVIKANFSR